MRLAIATVQVPYIKGGAELMSDNLQLALEKAGHVVEKVTMPFVHADKNAVRDSMDNWEAQDFTCFDAGTVDAVIPLKFPAYYLRHPNKIVWLTHQHRSVYDLWNTPYGDSSSDSIACELRSEIIRRDTVMLKKARRVYTISKVVSERLFKFNKIPSEVIYQPSPLHDLLSPGTQGSFILVPSRLESLKRIDLVIRAAAECKSRCMILVVGIGSMGDSLVKLAEELDLGGRVRFLGPVSRLELVALYKECLGVFFGPKDEDYGYVTLEAMQAAKPIITCSDSGGPLEFVSNGENGYVVDANPEAIAEKIDALYSKRDRALDLGFAGADSFKNLDLSWDRIVKTLLG